MKKFYQSALPLLAIGALFVVGCGTQEQKKEEQAAKPAKEEQAAKPAPEKAKTEPKAEKPEEAPKK